MTDLDRSLLGCSKCRFSQRGCKRCKDPAFQSRKRDSSTQSRNCGPAKRQKRKGSNPAVETALQATQRSENPYGIAATEPTKVSGEATYQSLCCMVPCTELHQEAQPISLPLACASGARFHSNLLGTLSALLQCVQAYIVGVLHCRDWYNQWTGGAKYTSSVIRCCAANIATSKTNQGTPARQQHDASTSTRCTSGVEC